MNENVYVTGNQGGCQILALTATEQVIDCTAWKGLYVKISAKGNAVKYCFLPSASGSLSDVDALDSATPASTAPDWVSDGATEHEVVPIDRPFLRVAAYDSLAAARLKVRPASDKKVVV